MNCPNCGGPMELVRDRDYFICSYCNGFHFPSPKQEGVRELDVPSGVPCPVCHRELEHASVGGWRVLRCDNCRGLLARQPTFFRIVRQQRSNATEPPADSKPLNKAELSRRIVCPLCDRPMETHPYYGPGNVIIDNCHHCSVIWLDYGELDAIARAPGPDRVWKVEWW